jgi:protein TonB
VTLVGSSVATRGWRRFPLTCGCAVALVLHAGVAGVLAHVETGSWRATGPTAVELDVLDKPAPPPPPLPESSPPAPAPRPVVRRAARPRLQAAPPPPNRETPPAPPTEEPPPPVFGVTDESVIAEDSPVAVPVGNTLMTKDRTPGKEPPKPLPAADPNAFAPVADDFVAEMPVLIAEVKPNYPEEARRLGIEGRVKLRVGVDRHGRVRSVKVSRGAGYGLDEAASEAMWQHRFKPARTADGRAVDHLLSYTMVFTFETP